RAAFWLKSGDDSLRYMYIASDDVNEGGTREGYAVLRSIMDTIEKKDFNRYRINLIPSNHPLAQEAIQMAQAFPEATDCRFGRQMFGNVYAEDGYLYAIPVTNSSP